MTVSELIAALSQLDGSLPVGIMVPPGAPLLCGLGEVKEFNSEDGTPFTVLLRAEAD